MSRDIFISYSRRDQEFVTRLASDINEQIGFVWFDRSTIQPGQKWYDEIMEGIQECKAFIVVLSPDAVASKYVREEVSKALELGKTIFPVIYRPAPWTGVFESLVRDIQTLDLRSGSYTYNFQKLVDGLIEAGAGKATGERPFLREPSKISLNVVFSKIPGWAFAWSLGWVVFWAIILIFLLSIAFFISSRDESIRIGSDEGLDVLITLLSAGIGGFAGGLLAGLFTMLALRPNAPSISWKHMSPTIRIWGMSGALGIVISGLITSVMIAVGAISVSSAETNCEGLTLGQCLGAAFGRALGEAIATVLLVLAVFLLFVTIAWFLTGMFAGWQVVRHIRRLEPGITRSQGWKVSTGWGCGAIVAAVVMLFLIGMISSALGL
jgi:hypothetical protein